MNLPSCLSTSGGTGLCCAWTMCVMMMMMISLYTYRIIAAEGISHVDTNQPQLVDCRGCIESGRCSCMHKLFILASKSSLPMRL